MFTHGLRSLKGIKCSYCDNEPNRHTSVLFCLALGIVTVRQKKGGEKKHHEVILEITALRCVIMVQHTVTETSY